MNSTPGLATIRHAGSLKRGASSAALALSLLFAPSRAIAQDAATTHVPDPADSSGRAANPNEAPGVIDKRAANAAASGSVTPRENEAEAQAAGAAVAAEGATPQQQEIVVTGFRRSLETAVAEKKIRDTVVESVSAEDIGKLPDQSIAESIARLPGLTAQRASGRDTTISIRGFAPDFSTTLLNGREQTSTGDNRAVEYDQYPAEIINEVIVYKTGQASLVGQGLSGTVDLRTIRPIEFGHRVISIGGRSSYDDQGKLNPDAREVGYRTNAVFVDQFADKKIGVSVAASYSDEPYEIQEFNAWGYFNPDSTGNAAISGSKSYNTSTELRRFGIVGTLEVKPTDTFTSTFDGFYSHFNDTQFHRGIELPFSYFGSVFNPAGAVATNGVYTSGTFNNVQGVVRNNAFLRRADLKSFGWNNSYKGDDGWNVLGDVSYNKTTRNERDLESYSGTGYNWVGNDPTNRDVTDTIGFKSSGKGTSFSHVLDYSNPNQIFLTDPLGWGGSVVQAGYNNNRVVNDRIWQYRSEIQRELKDSFISSVQFGVNYTNHLKSLDPQENFLVLANGSTQEVIPSQYIQKSTQLDYLGLGPILTYNPFDLIKGGIYALQPNTSPDVYAKAYSVSEHLMTIYTQANIHQDIGSNTLTGNFGVQAINTNQHSTGNQIRSDGTLTRYGDGADYWDILPSINLSFRTQSGFIVRAAAARQTVRPRMDDMTAALTYGTVNDPNRPGVIVPSGNRGDPRLRPFRSNSYDLTFEKYFGNRGYIALQGFYKDLKSYVLDQSVQVPFDFTGFTFTGQQPTTLQGFVTEPINVHGGRVYGAELAATLPLGQFVHALDGFGITGSGSYTNSKVVIPGFGPQALPGYSKWVGSGTLFFEKWGFSARGSLRYRSKFLGEVTGFGDSRVLRQAADETIVDAQVGYDFKNGFLRGLSIYIQGQNLTDERFKTYLPANKLEIIDYQKFGRRFLGGFTYKF